jgi:hypothetical protein
MIHKKNGITLWEILLFTVFLAVSIGASVFFFFINSTDMQKAQQKYAWVKNINSVLDDVSLEIGNAVILSHPFNGSSKECFYRGASDHSTLEPESFEEGFIFSDDLLYYISKESSATNVTRFGKHRNPILVNCKDGIFNRKSANQIEIYFKMNSPNGTETDREFRRIINLRNK